MKSALTRSMTTFPRYVLLAALCVAVLAAVPSSAAERTSAPAGGFYLAIDGQNVGLVHKVSGGATRAEVVTQALAGENTLKKHIATIKHEPFVIEIGMGMSRPIYEWMTLSLERDFEQRSGEVIAVDPSYQAVASREFSDALITEMTFPTLDGSSKDPAYLTVKFAPTGIAYKKGDGSTVAGPLAPKANAALCSNFRVEIGDLPTARVSKIDSFTIKQVVREAETTTRVRSTSPTTLEVPNLKLTVSMADLDPWQHWFEDFVINGKCSDADELSGSITLLAPDLTTELCRVDLAGVGVVSLQMNAAEANLEQVARFTVELYVESMAFEHLVR